MRKLLITSLLIIPLIYPVAHAQAFDPNYILADADLKNSSAMNLDEVRAFLANTFLGTYKTTDHEGRERYAADIIWRAAQNIGINPQFLLVLLQKEQGLITDDTPSEKQLDWATGYGICDTCSMSDDSLARFKGFGKQINSASLQFIEGYLADIAAYGKTAGRYGPEISITIDGQRITPENAATAALYAYTPHIEGNQNFYSLWNKWFGRDYPTGTLLQAAGEDGVWLMERGYRRAITSQSALQSRFDPKLIVTVSKTVLERFPVGKAINLPNYTLVKDETGKIYLLVDEALRHIDSMETFRKIGFSMDEVIDITSSEVAEYETGEPIVGSTQYPQGKVLSLDSGAMFYIKDGLRHLIIDKTVLNARLPGTTPELVDSVIIEQYPEGKPLNMPDGSLVRTPENAAVYVISNGERLLISSESIFTSFGYNWSNVKIVPEAVIKLHPLGSPLKSAADDDYAVANNSNTTDNN